MSYPKLLFKNFKHKKDLTHSDSFPACVINLSGGIYDAKMAIIKKNGGATVSF